MIAVVTSALCLLAGLVEGEPPTSAPVLGAPMAMPPRQDDGGNEASHDAPHEPAAVPIEIDLEEPVPASEPPMNAKPAEESKPESPGAHADEPNGAASTPKETNAHAAAPRPAPSHESPTPSADGRSGSAKEQPAMHEKEDIGELDPRLHEAVVSVLEKQVEDLKRTANALATRDAEGMEILEAIEGVDDELEALGVTSDRAMQVRQLSHEVRALRARLQLMELRAPTLDPTAKSSVLVAPQNEVLHPPPRVEVPKMELQGRSRFPSREAVIAFEDGDLDVVIGAVEGLNLGRVTPEALYAYGSALLERRRFDDARKVFARFEQMSDRPTLKESAARQLERMDRLATGIFTPTNATGEKER